MIPERWELLYNFAVKNHKSSWLVWYSGDKGQISPQKLSVLKVYPCRGLGHLFITTNDTCWVVEAQRWSPDPTLPNWAKQKESLHHHPKTTGRGWRAVRKSGKRAMRLFIAWLGLCQTLHYISHTNKHTHTHPDHSSEGCEAAFCRTNTIQEEKGFPWAPCRSVLKN